MISKKNFSEVDFLAKIALISAFRCPGNCGFQSNDSRAFTSHISKVRLCSICQKEFHGQRSKRDYDRHMNDHRKPNKLADRTCPYCGLVFDYKSGLKRHEKSKCFKSKGKHSANSLSKSKALGATRSDNVENKPKL